MPRVFKAISGERFSWLLDRLDLSQRAAARFLGLDERTTRRYASDQTPIDPRTAMLLEVMVRHKVTPEQALRLIGIDVKAALTQAAKRGAAPRFYEGGDYG